MPRARRQAVLIWRLLSQLRIRLLAFNVLLVFLPAAAHLYLGTYERELLEAQERAMVQQGRLISAALSEGGDSRLREAPELLARLNQRTESRIRVVVRDGSIIADSSRLGPRAEREEPTDPDASAEHRRHLLYRIGSFPVQLYRKLFQPPEPPIESGDVYARAEKIDGPEIQAALAGRYGAVPRVSTGGQRSVTLYSAIPIRSGEDVIGAVLVSQSTYRILTALYEVRIRVFKVILVSVAAAAILSLLVSTTIARPLRRLRNQAKALLDSRGRLKGRFARSSRLDEIGDLARSLEVLSRRLEDRMKFVESFASDVAHELKNPLASIRSATEILAEAATPEDKARFLAMVEHDVARMERMISGVQRLTRLDAELAREDERRPVDVGELLEGVVEGARRRAEDRVAVEVLRKDAKIVASASPDRLVQVFENIIENAVSFSPDGGLVHVEAAMKDGSVVVTVSDRGPGIREELLDRIFDRFFTYRPAGRAAACEHTGLGLSIARLIVEGYGGSIRASNIAGGGACFEVRLPTRA